MNPTERLSLLFSLCFFLICSASSPARTQAAADVASARSEWLEWRGPLGSGASSDAVPPVEWSEQRNVRFKVLVPGRGHASPVVVGQRIFLLSADKEVEPESTAAPLEGRIRYLVMAFDREGGELLWQKVAREASPHEGTHQDGSFASSSAVSDGETLYAFFGSRGLYAYSLDGRLLWEIDLGDMTTRRSFGEGASPALYGDTLVVNWDHEGDSFIVALDKSTGRERWRKSRDEPTSWSTPIIVEVDGRPQVIVSATQRMVGYDLATGDVIWHASGMTTNTIPTPIYSDGMLYAMSGFRGNSLMALRLAGARGDLTVGEHLVWSFDRDTPYVPSPVLYDGVLYFLKHNSGILSALDAASGKVLYGPVRVPGIDNVYASLVAADGKIYVTSREGTTAVIKAGAEFVVLAQNELDGGCEASPALVGDELFLRTTTHLYALADLAP